MRALHAQLVRRASSRSVLRRLTLQSARETKRPAGQLRICGTADTDKLGFGDANDRETPTALPALADVPISAVACGKSHVLALGACGDVYAWGQNGSGQLGTGNTAKAATPLKVDALSQIGVTALACGSHHSLALTEAGEVYSCGFGGSFWSGCGGLGHGDTAQLETPRKLEHFGGEVRAKTVSAGGYHSLVLDTEGRVWTWGRGEWGRLGLGDSSDALVPTQIDFDDDGFQPVAALTGETHSAVVGAKGELLTWGRNEHWQLGYEVGGLLNSGQSFDAQQEPQAVDLRPEGDDGEQPRVVRAAVDETGTSVQLSDGNVLVWGLRRYFEPTKIPAMMDVLGGETIAQVELGGSHVAVRTESGAVFTFGTGAALGHAKAERKSWELQRVQSLADSRVAHVECGPNITAFIVE